MHELAQTITAGFAAPQLLNLPELFHHLGECPARASEERERECVSACFPCEAMADGSYETFFSLPLWEGSGPETSFMDEDRVLRTHDPRTHNAMFHVQELAAIQTPALQARACDVLLIPQSCTRKSRDRPRSRTATGGAP